MTSTPKGNGVAAQPGDANALETVAEGSPMEKEQDTTSAALDIGVQGHIGRHLRAHYAALIDEAVPDNLLRLLHDLALERAPHSGVADAGDDT
jgi:hypothetical protein